jgi:hypothetical protein
MTSAESSASSPFLTRQGTCHCGKVSVTVTGSPRACSICHCSVCRSLTGAPFSIQSLHARQNMECNTPESDLWAVSTSKQVTRLRCKECGSPVYGSLGNGKMVAVPRSILFRKGKELEETREDGDVDAQRAHAATFAPTHHMYYADRTIDINDELPKYVGTSTPGRGVLWSQK